MYQYLIPKRSSTGKLKGNPKIHKDNDPLRTIVSGIKTPTERLAELKDYKPNKHVENTSSCIRDKTDFISKLKAFNANIPKTEIRDSVWLICCKTLPIDT